MDDPKHPPRKYEFTEGIRNGNDSNDHDDNDHDDHNAMTMTIATVASKT